MGFENLGQAMMALFWTLVTVAAIGLVAVVGWIIFFIWWLLS